MTDMTHDEIAARCIELDEMNKAERLVVHFLADERYTFRLCRQSVLWGMLSEGERFCMVKYGNYFLDEAEADAAIGRALKK